MTVPSLTNLATVLGDDEAYRKLGGNLGDRRDGRVYVHDERIRTAVRVAIAARRPLLLRGDPGSGKSSLAPFIARALGWRFYATTVTARTQARDLMWEFDALRRLSDAQVRPVGELGSSPVDHLEYYVEPKVLWWALNPTSAAARGLEQCPSEREAKDPGVGPRPPPENAGCVVLVDEIDKADPDVPNNLLECLGSLQFTVQETGFAVRADEKVLNGEQPAPLVIVTTNDERELPAAFLRRCATLYLRRHEKPQLLEIARNHFPLPADDSDASVAQARLFEFVADELLRMQGEARRRGRRGPSTAEYLDALKACLEICRDPSSESDLWQQISQLTLDKTDPLADKQPS
jgi:MoxR-like ATPase